RAITRTDSEDFDLPLRPRGRPGEADREVIVTIVRFGGGRGGGCAAELVAGGIQDNADHRPFVDACGPRYLDGGADGGAGIRTVDDDLQAAGNRGRGRGGQRRACGRGAGVGRGRGLRRGGGAGRSTV